MIMSSTLRWVLAASLAWDSRASILGVQPHLSQHYQGEHFTCLSGTNSLSSQRVNDDSCDCMDGSDEPGTSACSNGHFYCQNIGFKPKLLASTFVADGVCDCCDGSDEATGCEDTCNKLGEQATQSLRAKLKECEAGIAERSKLIGQAASIRATWRADQQRAASQKAKLATVVEQSNKRRDDLQQRKAALTAAAKEDISTAGTGESVSTTVTDHGGDADDSADKGGSDQDYESPDAMAEEQDADDTADQDPDAVAKRIAAQWTTDPDAAGDESSSDTEADTGESGAGHEDGLALPHQESIDTKTAHSEAEHDKGGGLLGRVAQSVGSMLGGSKGKSAQGSAGQGDATSRKELEDVTQQYKDAASQAAAHQRELDAAERSMNEARLKLERNHGPQHVFAYMEGKCYEKKIEKYVYRVCPFVKAVQADGGRDTSLGIFQTLNISSDGAQMQFAKGASCWQGGARSMKVTLQCGQHTMLHSVDEPEMCTYTATMSTPALCDETVAEGVQREIDALLGRNEDGVRGATPTPPPLEDL